MLQEIEIPSEYGLRGQRSHDWKSSPRRVLVVLQTVPAADLKNKLVGSGEGLMNAIKFARGWARRYDPNLPNFAWGVVNFNDRKHLELGRAAKAEAESEFKARLLRIIKAWNPTHILFSGDVSKIYDLDFAEYKSGWVLEFDGRTVVQTWDFERLIAKNGEKANCLGFWCRHLAHLLLGRHPHSLKGLTPKPVYVDTIARFDKMMAMWDDSPLIAVDTETKNLSVNHNQIYTIQFCFAARPDLGFMVPIHHPRAKLPKGFIQHVSDTLTEKFSAREGPELIMFNGMFDLRLIRTQFGIDFMHLRIWEIQAGEHLLDENISSLADMGLKSGNLKAVLCSYENGFYLDAEFGKEDRSTTGSVDPNDPGFLKYGTMDVQSIFYIRKMQIKAAAMQEIAGQSYKDAFLRHMRYQMSPTVHQLSILREHGSLLDKKYLQDLLGPNSILKKTISDIKEQFKYLPGPQQANSAILAESGFKSRSLFGDAAASTGSWLLSFTKAEHKKKLFFEVLGLEPVSKTQSGADAIDKDFISAYKDGNIVVSLYGDLQEASTLMSTFVKGWYKRLTTSLDGSDSHLRPDYVFFPVDTGRLASKDPNLQNIPARKKLAKIIKAMFPVPDGCLLIRFDYSAHEVRVWSIISGDTVLAAAFRAGQDLRKRWIKTPTDEIKSDLKKQGDIHIQNIFRFFQKWVEKSDPLRDIIKGIVFGSIYGMSAKTLGEGTKRSVVDEIKEKIAAAYKAGDKKAQTLHERELKILLSEDRTEYAQSILDKMFGEFKRAHKWILRMQELATNKYYVYSPIGRVRHLYAAILGDRRITSKQVRRGMNAPIQGLASEIGVKGSHEILKSYYKELPKFKPHSGLAQVPKLKFNRIVHDASYFSVPYHMVLPFVHILQWEATYGVARAYEREFGLKFTVEPEIEIEIGVRDSASLKWDWSLAGLHQIIKASVEAGIKDGTLTEDKDDIMAQIYRPWKNSKMLAYLNKNYPLLNVDLETEIRKSVEAL